MGIIKIVSLAILGLSISSHIPSYSLPIQSPQQYIQESVDKDSFEIFEHYNNLLAETVENIRIIRFPTDKAFQEYMHHSAKHDNHERLAICSNLKCIEIIGISNELQINLKQKDLCDIMKTFFPISDEVVSAHTHPKSILASSKIYPPNSNDIIMHSYIKECLTNQTKLVSEVYDGYGRWSYNTSDDLQRFIIRGHPLDPEIGMFSLSVNWASKIEKSNISNNWERGQKINYLSQEASKIGILLEYNSMD